MVGGRGFTLLEMMITVVIATVLLTLAVPSMRSFLLTSALGDASTSLYGGLVLARAEAITRNSPVTVCQRDFTNPNVFPVCGGSGGWASGWIVYHDSNPSSTGAKPYVATDVIAVGDPVNNAFSIVSNPANAGPVQFDAAGRSATSSITFYLCKSGDTSFQGRSILIELSGHIALAPYASCTT